MDVIVIIAVLPFALMFSFAILMFIAGIFTTVGSVGERKNIMKHAEYDYYELPSRGVRLDDGS